MVGLCSSATFAPWNQTWRELPSTGVLLDASETGSETVGAGRGRELHGQPALHPSGRRFEPCRAHPHARPDPAPVRRTSLWPVALYGLTLLTIALLMAWASWAWIESPRCASSPGPKQVLSAAGSRRRATWHRDPLVHHSLPNPRLPRHRTEPPARPNAPVWALCVDSASTELNEATLSDWRATDYPWWVHEETVESAVR